MGKLIAPLFVAAIAVATCKVLNVLELGHAAWTAIVVCFVADIYVDVQQIKRKL
jgi:hypothetical protein